MNRNIAFPSLYKRLVGAFCMFFVLHQQVGAQIKPTNYPDSVFTTYYHQRVSMFKKLPMTQGDIIFLGNSITEGGSWGELFTDIGVKNRGISGDFTVGVMQRMDEIVQRKPSKVFLMIGINDLSRNISPDSIVKNITWIANFLKQEVPSAQLYVQSILPVNEVFKKFDGHTSKGSKVLEVNEKLRKLASSGKYIYIDLYSHFCDEQGKLNKAYTNDGLHLLGDGYMLWKHLVYPYVYDVQQKPALCPTPKFIQWRPQVFPLYKCANIVLGDARFMQEANQLQYQLSQKGIVTKLVNVASEGQPIIEIDIDSTEKNIEAYALSVTEKRIRITAATANGIFYGIQTLLQLMRDNVLVDVCEIADAPSFSWRGFMVDVGRNFQSIQQLKQQIDVMAAYKMNIFHFHLTENIAWRLQSKLYPQLTDSKYMLRNQGAFYTVEDMIDLIAYCKKRYITLIPEIDMPGHSDAFKRAMGVDMQSEKGVEICKNILKEICTTYDISYLHIGGDEVKIDNANFLPTMVEVVKSYGKKPVAWNPGGNVPEGTVVQMWTGDTKPKKNYPSVDSRHLYLNHFDPIDGVVTVFNHKICDTVSGDQHLLGATLCNWPDRRVSKEEDLISMNAVYPVMLTFAERTWQGGGWGNFLSDIDKPGTDRYNAFVAWEKRLLEHKTLYFKGFPFPYHKQSDLEWKLIGPFKNNGKTETVFIPESAAFMDTVHVNRFPSVWGGTIWLQHFWSPMIQSHLRNQEDSTTWYAVGKFWSEEDKEKDCWIGFNNISRSPATHSPPVGAWDNKNSIVWVNGKVVMPPVWNRGGQQGDSEIPLVVEGYEYRAPTKIYLKKGWNIVRIKAPVGSFKGEWQNPVKWMFSFVPF